MSKEEERIDTISLKRKVDPKTSEITWIVKKTIFIELATFDEAQKTLDEWKKEGEK